MPNPKAIIAVVSTKGGVGKTSIAFNIAGVLANGTNQVLVCDVDAQADISGVFADEIATDPDEAIRQLEEKSPMYRAIVGGEHVDELIRSTAFPNISILASGMDLYDWDEPLGRRMSPERRLRNALKPIKEQYEYIIIDCPPRPDKATQMGLVAASAFLVPVDASPQSVGALRRVLKLAEDARTDGGNRELRFAGCVLNKFQGRTNLDRHYLDVYRDEAGDKFLKTQIPQRKPYQEAHTIGEPITLAKPDSELAEVFKQLITEIGL